MPAARRHCESGFLEQMSHLSCDKVKATSRSANHDTLIVVVSCQKQSFKFSLVRSLCQLFILNMFLKATNPYIGHWSFLDTGPVGCEVTGGG
ncbi:hypothetical protein JNUCC1_00490 [Lentibacillus sp. JNUCC-1]|nr:hypothetical protein [Lentibacillus sp. JNUCC-1]